MQGCLGIVASLPFEIFKILIDLQNTMQERYPDAGLTKLDEYRGIRQDKNKFYEPCQNFIDGDYIQDFLKLSLID